MSKVATISRLSEKRQYLSHVLPSLPANLASVIDAVLTTPPNPRPHSQPKRRQSDAPATKRSSE